MKLCAPPLIVCISSVTLQLQISLIVVVHFTVTVFRLTNQICLLQDAGGLAASLLLTDP